MIEDESAIERERRDLLSRAYGPHPDIQDDPAALARLAELESAHRVGHASAAASGEAVERGHPEPVEDVVAAHERVEPAAISGGSRVRRRWIVGGSLLFVGVVLAGVIWNAVRPEATLHPTGIAPDTNTFSAVALAPLAEVDDTTLRGFESYLGLEPWLAENAQGSRCLMMLQASTMWGIRCAPPEADLMIDIGSWPLDPGSPASGLAPGSVLRFQLRGDAIDVSLFVANGG
jgi:hypothetical protein